MALHIVQGLANTLDTNTTSKWLAEPAPCGNSLEMQLIEELHQMPDGTWVMHTLRRFWPPVPGRTAVEDSWQVSNEQHAVLWMQKHSMALPEELKPVAEAMERRGRRMRRRRQPLA